ncbi:conjugal transfer protein TraF [Vibrio coralliilyticus]|uniref:conjugal transfer protein TraF n=1 Tax=Vibrio coralliilyticus TaxID=190893 RepID=UPI0003914BA2|nr:conjugal transfer protein TraF [Vibrio coralliilyticus]AXN33074.1 conjugal transfer protein TraF [Vibrio coralliilyticus]ERB66570.1 conjugal transfer protein TraF [Vibrio coralliilyticus OCN008]KPH23806.1 conjugal transfer protein TraF [Vibrio coralliilyticus]NOI56237.1 conjugal transfer protein TraF [Vibrio coralliilyticus]NRF29146.1 conjugal transfer protein TraF [Vibrio coralliilyticus]
MKNSIKILSLSIALASTSSYAATYAVEARGDAMGGVGVVSANFLTAPFYNPAITAIYRRNDDVGMIIPSFGLAYNDEHNMVDDLDKVSGIIDSALKDINSVNVSELQSSLDALKGDVAKLEIGGAVAFAIPNSFIAANFFGKAYAESFAQPDIYDGASTPDSDLNTVVNAELSAVNAVAIGVAEVGISLAKYQTFLGQHISFGVSPKIQRIYTYVYSANLNNYDIKDVRDNGTGETMFNMDAGFLWFRGPFRVGVAATNLVSRDIQTQTLSTTVTSQAASSAGYTESRTITNSYAYQMRPQYTVGVGLVADYATLSVDYDINEDERYTNFNDNTQYVRVGGEIDIMRQLKLRAGWRRNLAYDNLDDTITAGIGLSPLNLFQMDIGASYTNENSMGAYINFLGSY